MSGVQISDLKVRIMCLSLQVIRIERPLRCLGFPPICCCCCLQQVEVQSPPGTVIGYIKQDLSFLSSWFSVVNVDEEVVLKITGPPCRFGEVEFQVYFFYKLYHLFLSKSLLFTITTCRFCQLMAVRRWGRLPSSGLGWPRSTSLMQTTLEYNVSQISLYGNCPWNSQRAV